MTPTTRTLIAEHAAGPELKGTRFVVEPGRFLVGESGIYVTRVTAIKESRKVSGIASSA